MYNFCQQNLRLTPQSLPKDQRVTQNVSFPHEAIRGLDFFSSLVDVSTSAEKSLTQELPYGEKAFSNKAINKLVFFSKLCQQLSFCVKENQSI